jgi:hypothetical protein
VARILVEYGMLLIPYLAQAEGYFREIAPEVLHGCDVDQEWDLLSHRQEHQPAGVTRLLEVLIDESGRQGGTQVLDGRVGLAEGAADVIQGAHGVSFWMVTQSLAAR